MVVGGEVLFCPPPRHPIVFPQQCPRRWLPPSRGPTLHPEDGSWGDRGWWGVKGVEGGGRRGGEDEGG